jgi:phage tail tube protein FII
MRFRGPWAYDWNPPMPQLIREFSASFLVCSRLENTSVLPGETEIAAAIATVKREQQKKEKKEQETTTADRSGQQKEEEEGNEETLEKKQLQVALKHSRLDEKINKHNVLELATALASLTDRKQSSAAASLQ